MSYKPICPLCAEMMHDTIALRSHLSREHNFGVSSDADMIRRLANVGIDVEVKLNGQKVKLSDVLQ